MQDRSCSEGTYPSTGHDIPNLDALTSGRQQLAVRRKRRGPGHDLIPESTRLLAGYKIPKADGLILTGRNHLLAIRSDHEGLNPQVVSSPLSKRSAGERIPQAKEAIVIAGP